MRNSEFFQNFRGFGHDRQIGITAHNHTYQNIIFLLHISPQVFMLKITDARKDSDDILFIYYIVTCPINSLKV
jgi:hypothetical protein